MMFDRNGCTVQMRGFGFFVIKDQSATVELDDEESDLFEEEFYGCTDDHQRESVVHKYINLAWSMMAKNLNEQNVDDKYPTRL